MKNTSKASILKDGGSSLQGDKLNSKLTITRSQTILEEVKSKLVNSGGSYG